MKVDVSYKDGMTVVSVEGEITSANAGEFEQAIANEPSATGGIIIDAHGMNYISSAGLRVILAAKKRCGDLVFKVIGVNQQTMNIFNVTGFSEIMDIEPALRQVSIEGCKKIGAGACGECFRLDDETIIKLYYANVGKDAIELEKSLAKKAFVMGVPTAISYDIVECDGRTGVVYELIKSKTISELIRENPDEIEKYTDMYADVCKKIGSIHAGDADLPSFKDLNRVDIPKITGITDEEREKLYRFIDLVPDSDTCIHGDLNINNIMVQNGECCLIDMGEFSTGLRMFDISRIVFSMKYGKMEGDDFNSFYKLPTATCDKVFELFMKKYFGCETMEEAEEKYPEVKWLEPLAWFRCATSMLKGNRWPAEKREMAEKLLREKLIPFIDSIE